LVRGRRIALLVLSTGLALASCGRSDPAGDGSVFHPGEADPVRSAQARDEVKACAKDHGWHLDDLELLVDAEGLLIRIAYRSRHIAPDTSEHETVDGCLDRAGVTQPPPNL
jgi:hypothetical protein